MMQADKDFEMMNPGHPRILKWCIQGRQGFWNDASRADMDFEMMSPGQTRSLKWWIQGRQGFWIDESRADKDGDGEISREDWHDALTKAGVEISKLVSLPNEWNVTMIKDGDGW